MNEFVVVTADDWAGLYLNGQRIDEGHRIRLEDFAEAVIKYGGEISYYRSLECDFEWCEENGGLPETLKEVKFADGVMLPAGLNHSGVPDLD